MANYENIQDLADDLNWPKESEEESEEMKEHTQPHWAHLAFALGSARGLSGF